jgi:protein involved in polysaccharide export with SLBB domain
MKKNNALLLKMLLSASCMLVLTGCSIDHKLRNQQPEERELDIITREYILRPGDQVTLFYSIKQIQDSTKYVLEPGDQVRLVVSDRDDISRLYTIAPDGLLYLPSTHPVEAAGKPALAVEDSIKAALKHLTMNATVLVSFERFNSRTMELISSLSPLNGQGPVFRSVVGYDSTIVLPHLQKIKCVGKTFNQLIDTVEGLYRKNFSSLQIIPLYENSSLSTVTVLGEVYKPGAFPVSGRVTLSTALGLAGGWQKSAFLSTIIVIQRKGSKVLARSLDFNNDLITVSQLTLSAGDVVFVPSNAITSLNVWVDEYIRKMIPIGVGIGVPTQW